MAAVACMQPAVAAADIAADMAVDSVNSAVAAAVDTVSSAATVADTVNSAVMAVAAHWTDTKGTVNMLWAVMEAAVATVTLAVAMTADTAANSTEAVIINNNNNTVDLEDMMVVIMMVVIMVVVAAATVNMVAMVDLTTDKKQLFICMKNKAFLKIKNEKN